MEWRTLRLLLGRKPKIRIQKAIPPPTERLMMTTHKVQPRNPGRCGICRKIGHNRTTCSAPRCGICRKIGHDRRTCESSPEQQAKIRAKKEAESLRLLYKRNPFYWLQTEAVDARKRMDLTRERHPHIWAEPMVEAYDPF